MHSTGASRATNRRHRLTQMPTEASSLLTIIAAATNRNSCPPSSWSRRIAIMTFSRSSRQPNERKHQSGGPPPDSSSSSTAGSDELRAQRSSEARDPKLKTTTTLSRHELLSSTCRRSSPLVTRSESRMRIGRPARSRARALVAVAGSRAHSRHRLQMRQIAAAHRRPSLAIVVHCCSTHTQNGRRRCCPHSRMSRRRCSSISDGTRRSLTRSSIRSSTYTIR